MFILEESSNKGFFKLDGLDLPKNHFAIIFDNVKVEAEKNFTLFNVYNNNKIIESRGFEEIQGVSNWGELLDLIYKLQILKAGVNNDTPALDVVIQDSTSPVFDLFFSKPLGIPTTLLSAAVKEEYTVEVESLANIAVGVWLGIFSGSGRYYWGEVLEVNGNVLTLDTPLDYSFEFGSNVLPTTRNLNVDGSTTPQIFSIQAGSSGLEIDVTRLLFSIVSDEAIELDRFGDRLKLERGLVLRKKNGVNFNYWNVKTNYEFGLHSFDVARYEQVKQNDLDAFLVRNSYGGQDKHGAVIRIGIGDELQLIVQDDLTSQVVISAIAQGSEVVN